MSIENSPIERLLSGKIDRRRFLAIAGAGSASALLGISGQARQLTQTALAQEPATATITGQVFAQTSGNGRPALKGVLVSDGKNTTLTDNDGRYSLTVDPERRISDQIFVSLPEGYRVPTNEVRTPRFFVPLGNLSAGEAREQDFELTPATELRSSHGQFIHLTDVHVSDYGRGIAYERERFRDQIIQLNRLSGQQDFIMLSGDLSNLGTDTEYQNYQDAAADSRHTIWTSVGNHEWGGNGEDRTNYAQEVENYRRYQGPEWYSFEYRGYHVVVIENYDAGDLSPQGEPESTRDNDQFEWLSADLAAAGNKRPLIVIAHIAMNDPLTIPGTSRYIELLRQYNVKLALTGHTHRNDVDPNVFPGGFHVITEPAWSSQDGGPLGFRRINVAANGSLSFPFKAFDIEQKLVILNPGPGQQIPADTPLTVQINAYNTTSEVASADVRIDGGPWRKLRQDGVWTWTAKEPHHLPSGEHTIEARVRDDADQEWSTEGSFTATLPAQLANPQSGSNWATFLGNNTHTGVAADVVKPPLRLAWSYRSGGAILASSPAIVDGVAFIGIKDENGVDKNGVVALDVVTGGERWRVSLDAAVDGTPSVADGVVYASSIRGTVHAFDAATGSVRWERRYGVAEDGVQRWWGYACPIVANGIVYQSMGFVLIALDAASGDELWRFNGGGANSYLGMPALSEDGKIVYFNSKGDALWGLDAASGQQLWRKNPVDGLFRSTVAVAGGIVYARTGDIVLAVDGQTGTEVRRYTGLGYTQNQESPAITGNLLISPGNNGRVLAYDIATGQQVWAYRTDGEVYSSPAISGDTVYFGSHDGFLYALDRRTGALLWRYEIGPWVKSSAAVSGNMVIVGAYDGNVYGFVEHG